MKPQAAKASYAKRRPSILKHTCQNCFIFPLQLLSTITKKILCKIRHPHFEVDRQEQGRVFVQSRVKVNQQGRQHGRHHQYNQCLRTMLNKAEFDESPKHQK